MAYDNIFDISKINKKDIYIKENHCFILFDVETCNGFDRKNNAIIQISFMLLGTNYIYNTFCKPDSSTPWMINNKYFTSKIKKEDVINSPKLENVLQSLKYVIYCINNTIPIFIAHNSSFDKNMLNLCLKSYNIDLGYIKWCNTMNKLFFNIKDKNNKNIRSLEKIAKYLFNDLYINFHDAKNDVEILYKCLLKIHNDNDKISSIVLSIIKRNVCNKNIFIPKCETISTLKNFDENCILNIENCILNIENIDEANLIKIYKDILEKEKEISKYKNMIRNRLIDILNNNDNYLCIDGEETFLNEYTFKQLDCKELKDANPDIYNKYTKEVKYKRLIIKNNLINIPKKLNAKD